MSVDKIYLELVSDVLDNGVVRNDRTGTGTISVFGRQARFNLQDGFPLLSLKHTSFKNIVHELLWFLSGDTNIGYLNRNGVHIWDEWADENGELGPIYGHQWRRWGGMIDQVRDTLDLLKQDPNTRRAVISAWQPSQLPNHGVLPSENPKMGAMALAPCHCMFQFYVVNDRLSCLLYQRSADLFLGVPYNIASYALLTMIFADHLGLEYGELVHSFGDLHLYRNHLGPDIVGELLSRDVNTCRMPKVVVNRSPSMFFLTRSDFQLVAYNPYPAIKAPISV